MKVKIQVEKGEKFSAVASLNQRTTGADLQNHTIEPGGEISIDVDEETRLSIARGTPVEEEATADTDQKTK